MPHRLLFVHAHPDDETLTCGVTMAHHVAMGDEVHVLTCTLGEEGEVIPAELRHLAGRPDDALAAVRYDELREALSRIGAQLHILGADPGAGRLSRYRDSGMAGSAAAARPEAFVGADLDEAGQLVADLVRAVRPDAVATYDPQGGYGHPDHIQAHRVTRAALDRLPDEDLPGRVFEILVARSWALQDRALLPELGAAAYGLVLPRAHDPFPPSVVPDARVTHVVEDSAARAVKNAALRAHRTQVTVVSEDLHALSNNIAARTSEREGFGRVDPRTWAPIGVGERHGSLFS
ncbi:N-acetyl-1-D-myo-inositol-2-amino-2-deoxy-alpha-D-glucopyranoside deacetylase [Intrasporangium sp.]|uniref:N-acetyl-1-D-myo-inositol-2-amino-2-deoxy-alpha- D-glucopyranoside deacetylase n=1 Tax=Intrasporangium sp. TaxID=1925024 RepID=UPI003221541E